MVERIKDKQVVGIKQSTKVLKTEKCKTLYIAKDANLALLRELENLAKDNSVEIVYIDTMRELGKLCGIDVKASVAVTLI